MEIKAFGLIQKAAKLKEGEIEFVVSTDAWDAHGERINVEGIDIRDYKKNPVILWAHDGWNLPIGKAIKIWKDGRKLMARALFKINDEFPRKVYEYIVDGFLNAVSIGGVVEEWAEDGVTIERLTMKEFSVVPIPANKEALVAAKQFTGEQKAEFNGLAKAYARKVLLQGSDTVVEQIKVLESLVATLKEIAVAPTDGEPHEERAKRRVVLRQAQAVDNQTETVIRSIKLKGSKDD